LPQGVEVRVLSWAPDTINPQNTHESGYFFAQRGRESSTEK